MDYVKPEIIDHGTLTELTEDIKNGLNFDGKLPAPGHTTNFGTQPGA